MKSECVPKILTWICLSCMLMLLAACSREARAKRHLDRADRFFSSGEYAKGEIEYLKVLQQDRANVSATRNLGIILFEQGRYPESLEFLQRAKAREPGNLNVRGELAFIALLGQDRAKAREEALFILGREAANEEALILLADSAEGLQIKETKAQLEGYRTAAEKTAGFHVAMGLLHVRANETEAAEASFKEAVRLNPQSPVAHATLGNFYLRQQRFELAEAEMKAAANAAPLRSPFVMSHANFKIEQGQIDEGKKLLEAIIQKVPDFVTPRIRLAELALAQRNYDECATVLKAIFSRGQGNFNARLLQGRLQLARGNANEALAEFQRLATVFPKVPAVHHQLALAHVANRDSASASASVEEALRLDPDFTDAILLQAELNIRRGEFTSAVAALSELSRRETNSVQTRLLLAAAQAGRQDYAAALAEYQKLAKAFPKNPRFAVLAGNMHLRQKNLAEARAAYEAALALNAEYFPAVQRLVALDLAAGNYQGALQRVQPRIDAGATNAALRSLQTKIFLAQGHTNQAEAALLKAIELDPSDHEAHMLMARIYIDTGRHQAALERLQSVIQKRRTDVAAHLQAAAIYDGLKDFRRSEEHYQKMLATEPTSPVALNNVAYIYSEHLNQLDRAYEMAQKARAVLPRDPGTADTLGWILYKRADYTRALTLLEESAQALPDNPEVLFHLGMTHYAMGNERAARTSFERSLAQGIEFTGKAECQQRLSIMTGDVLQADTKTVAELEKLLAERPSDPILLGRMAHVYEAAGQWDKAARTYEKILAQNPNSVPAMTKLASYHLEHGNDPKKAMDWAQKARKIAPNDPEVAHILGRSAYGMRDYKWSLSLLQEAARRLKDDPRLAYDLARAQLSNGQLSQAEGSLKQAAGSVDPEVRLAAEQLRTWVLRCLKPDKAEQFEAEIQGVTRESPGYLPARFLRGCVLQKKGDFNGAEATFEEILREYPAFAPANRELAYLYTQHLNNDPKAWDHIMRAREGDGENPRTAKTFGIMQYKRAEFRRSADLLKDSAKRNAADAETLFYLGMAHFKLSEPQESGKALREAVALDPNGRFVAEAKAILAELQ